MKISNNAKHYFVLTAILILSFHGFSQENNLIDKNGLKQGFWWNFQNDTTHYGGIAERGKDGVVKILAKPCYEITHRSISKGNYLDDKLEGLWTFYYDCKFFDKNKTIRSTVFYKGDSVVFENLYKKEIIKSEVEFKTGKPTGQLRIYYDTGQLMFSGEMMPDERFYKVTEYYKTGGKHYEKKLSVDYIIETYTSIKEIK
jgi:antitoxin component YwqK of YwqJK toxin-antitoxin module